MSNSDGVAAKGNSGPPLALRSEIDIEDLRSGSIAFSRRNLSYSERYFLEMFETHGPTGNIAYSVSAHFHAPFRVELSAA